MKVVVFGANGRTGRAVLLTLLAEGYQVTAFARDPAKLPEWPGHDFAKIRGDALNPTDVAPAVAGQDAVIVCLGDSSNPVLVRLGMKRSTARNICEAGTANIVDAMQDAGVKRLICVTAYGMADTRRKLSPAFRAWHFAMQLDAQLADKERQERIVRASDLDWTLVRPVGLTDGAFTGRWLASATGERRKRTISRVDLARFIVDTLTGGGNLHEAIVVSGLTIKQAFPND
ncbi:NAD(P)H-binding protein [Rhodocyclus tenuis]|uniref:NAD(P)-dependent oxidoreductase n=1 Tax=Rhodocyclus gracilis TaxID=2929842 RepID=UPI0013542A7A|nr:NAD(P)H-binding protein [Rhodocyclus gracilis]